MVQGLRMGLPVQGSGVPSLVHEASSCGTAEPAHHDWASAPEPGSKISEAHEPKARAQQQEKPPPQEACTLQLKRIPHPPQPEDPQAATKTQHGHK